MNRVRNGCCLLPLLAAGLLPVVAAARSPEPLPGYSQAAALRAESTLRAVAFVDGRQGIACGDRGAIIRTSDGGETWWAASSGVDCILQDVVWLDQQRVVIVGGGYDRITQLSRGVVLISGDRGEHWTVVAGHDLPRLQRVDRRSDGVLVAHGDWSNSLLARDFESRSSGQTWQRSGAAAEPSRPDLAANLRQWTDTIGFPVAVRDACRIGTTGVCAVGDHGVVWISRDIGRSWSAVHGGSRHSAVLVVADSPASVAWSLVGSESLEHHHRVAVLVGKADEESLARVRQATVMMGGSGADHLQGNSPKLDHAAEHWIAVHQPAALILDAALDQSTQTALIRAASESGVASIATYRVDPGAARHSNEALLPGSGVLLSDLTTDALQVVAPNQTNRALASLNYQYSTRASNRRDGSVVDNMQLSPGQRLDTKLGVVSRRQMQIVQARLGQRARIQQLLKEQSVDQFSRALQILLDQTPADDRLRLAWTLLVSASDPTGPAAAGRLACQQALLREIAQRFESHSVSGWAALRLAAIEHSVEQSRLRRFQPRSIDSGSDQFTDSVTVSPFQDSTGEVRQVAAIAPLIVPKPEVLELNPRKPAAVPAVDLAWEFHPWALLAREAARLRGDDNQLQSTEPQRRELNLLARSTSHRWNHLVDPRSTRQVIATRTTVPPKLDGVLDDDCWQSALSTAASSRVRLAYDDDYVYVAIEQVSDALRRTDPSAGQTQGRDHPLVALDRVALQIDIDRDLIAPLQFQIHNSQLTRDAIDGDPSWQPTWYVDTVKTDRGVTVEMAILRRDLVDLPILPGDSWYVSSRTLRAGTPMSVELIPDPAQWLRVRFR